MQGDGIAGKRSTSGSFDEYFPVVEMLLDHLENAMEGVTYEEDVEKKLVSVGLFEGMHRKTRRLLKVYIKLGWKKLDKYYNLLNSPAYVGAVVFHPCKKWPHLQRLWDRLPCRQAAGWKKHYDARLQVIWEAKYKDMSLDNRPEASSTLGNGRMDYIERRLALARSADKTKLGRRPKQPQASTLQDELAQYCAEPPIDNAAYKADPLAWWRHVGAERFPRLSYMAVDFLTIASSSAETERDFSSAGRMISPLRNRLRRHIIGMAQCLRSWSKSGIYEPSLPFNLLEEPTWRTVLATLA